MTQSDGAPAQALPHADEPVATGPTPKRPGVSKRGASKKRTDVDRAVAGRIRELRMAAGLTQAQLAKSLGVSFQQAQKYEAGLNRLSASAIVQLCTVLNCDPNTLFGWNEARPTARSNSFALETIRMMHALPERDRRALVVILKSLAEREAAPATGAPSRRLGNPDGR